MKVIVQNIQFKNKDIWFFDRPEFFEYEGQETKLKHVNVEEALCLTTGLQNFPVRVIPRKLIVSIDGSAVEQKPQDNKVIQQIVKGSKGQEYILTKAEGKWTCTCPGFQFRRTCKHVAEAT